MLTGTGDDGAPERPDMHGAGATERMGAIETTLSLQDITGRLLETLNHF
tara:strand:+ start:494 stop:640 length:147 start_codon:yes stop_codon:yes gene_type:complete